MRWIAMVLVLACVAAPARADDADADDHTHHPFFADAACPSCPGWSSRAVEPGFFAPVGSLARDVEVDGSLASNGDLVGGTLALHGILHRFDRYLSLVGGISTGFAYRSTLAHEIGAMPVLELGLLARSECDRWHVLGTAAYGPPGVTYGSPADWQTATSAVLTLGPWSSMLFLPRAAGGAFLFTFDGRVRTDGEDGFFAFRFGFRAGRTEVGSQFGVLRGFVGALAFELTGAVRRVQRSELNLSFGARLEIDLSAFWPANSVAPSAVTFPLRWSPDRGVAVELFAGFSWFVVGGAPDVPTLSGIYGLRVTGFVDL